jgi:hypothetical protein
MHIRSPHLLVIAVVVFTINATSTSACDDPRKWHYRCRWVIWLTWLFMPINPGLFCFHKVQTAWSTMSGIRLSILVSNLLNPIIAVKDFNYDKDSSTLPHCLTNIGKNISICSKNVASEISGSISWIADVVTISFRQTGEFQHPWSAQLRTPEPRHARVSWDPSDRRREQCRSRISFLLSLYAQFLQ